MQSTMIVMSLVMLMVMLMMVVMPTGAEDWKLWDSREVEYKGCFPAIPSDHDPDRHRVHDGAVMSYGFCERHCAGFRYMGIQNGDTCFCFDDFSERYQSGKADGKSGSDGPCSSRCPLNGHDCHHWAAGIGLHGICKADDIGCGGPSSSSLYERPAWEKERSVLGDLYIGCYTDTWDRDLPDHKYTDSRLLNIETCLFLCRQYTYFGLQNGNQCFCGNSYGRHSHVPDWSCNKLCPGGRQQNCGRGWANAVYRTTAPYRNPFWWMFS